MLRFRSLGSGSAGNASLIQARSGAGCTHVLVDCGLGVRELGRRLGAAGLLADQIDAIFVTHEHGDHVGCAVSLARRERIPIWMSAGTYAAIGHPDLDGLLRFAESRAPIDLGDLQLLPFAVPHDASEPLQLRCTDGQRDLGILTDLGHVNDAVTEALRGVHSLFLECNHDPEMLRLGPYPYPLKRRVGGLHGHLNNTDAAQAAARWKAHGLERVVAAHLSETNNRPELALGALRATTGWVGPELGVASASAGCPWFDV